MITFHGITNLGDDNMGEPFLGIISQPDPHAGIVFGTGMITGNITDIWDMYVDFDDIKTIDEWEKVHEAKIEQVSWQDACRRKLEWLLEKLDIF